MSKFNGAKLLLLLCSLVLFPLLVACGADTATPTTVQAPTQALATATVAVAAPTTAAAPEGAAAKLTIWHYWDGQNADSFNALVKQYTAAHPNTQINVVNVPGGELLTKIQAAASSDTLPSIAITDLVWVPRVAQTGKLVDLAPYMKAANMPLDDIYPALLSFGKSGDQQLAVPVSTNNLALMYNRDIYEKAGISAPPKTWEELVSDSKTIQEKAGVPGYELNTQPGDTGEGVTWNFMVNLWQAGGEFLNSDNSAAAFNSDAGRKALQFWVDAISQKVSPLGPWGAFEKDQAASAQEGSWMVGIWKADPPFSFDTAELPIPTGGKQATNLGGEQAMVFKSDAATQQAAADFLAWFLTPDNVLTWNEQTGFLPVRKSVAEGATYQSWVDTNEPRLKPFIAQLPFAHARPNTPLYPQVSLAFAKEVEQAVNGKKTVAQALSDAEQAVNTILKSGQ